MVIVEIYVLCGVLLVATLLYAAIKNNICGEHLLMLVSPKASVWFREHPVIYRLAVILFLCSVVLLWPFIMVRLVFYDD